jgi:hypothetical protein
VLKILLAIYVILLFSPVIEGSQELHKWESIIINRDEELKEHKFENPLYVQKGVREVVGPKLLTIDPKPRIVKIYFDILVRYENGQKRFVHIEQKKTVEFMSKGGLITIMSRESMTNIIGFMSISDKEIYKLTENDEFKIGSMKFKQISFGETTR